MKKVKKIFLPQWQRYIFVPLFAFTWVLITYLEFFGNDAGELGVIGYVLLSVLFLGLMVLMWFMTNGRLPAYMMEEESEDE